LFTGLAAKTHFGRPNFQDFLMSLKYEHPNVSQLIIEQLVNASY